MFGTDVRKLIEKLNSHTMSLLDHAAGFCLTRTHYKITIEHLLLKAIEDDSGDISQILRRYDIESGKLQSSLLHHIEKFQTGNGAKPTFSAVFLEQIEQAWLFASVNQKEETIRSGYVLYALLNQPEYLSAYEYGELLSLINIQDLGGNYFERVRGSSEELSVTAPIIGKEGKVDISDESYLGRYTTDFTGMAATGKIDPVIRRDKEIRELVGILARRRKNNPICVGDPGVGKSAIIEGLALRIVQNDVPSILKGVIIRGLDMGMLQAGAGVKGEFEKRLKGVIDEVKASEVPIILFIDEAHTMIGAGGPSGGSDAANLLKPALARGELRTIASTTWSEYKKYFEKDAALARRFQLVKIDEPSVEYAIDIARGLKNTYEEAHQVMIRDDALVASVQLSDRYISGRQLPDKAIDLLDTACARVRINRTSKPAVIEDVERNLDAINRTLMSLDAEEDLTTQQREIIEQCSSDQCELENKKQRLDAQWQAEIKIVEEIVRCRDEKNIEQVIELKTKLVELQDENGLISPEVDFESICSVVTDWTGVPLSKMIADEASTVLNLEDRLGERIKGQESALKTLSEAIRSSKAGVKPEETPVGCCLCVGPSGVGKTETALAIADTLFGGERFMTTINMSEFQEKHTVSRLVGSPPGYVGYGEGGYLTEALRRTPYSIVLIDETEKAHPDVLNIFYQVFDKGILSDGEGREVDCRNALFLLTSNLATDTITKMTAKDTDVPMEDLVSAIRPELSSFFKPALLARMTIVPYVVLGGDVLRQIALLKLNKLKDRVFNAQRIKIKYDDRVVDEIVDRCREVETGARNIDQIIARFIMPDVSRQILHSLSEGLESQVLYIDYQNDDFTFSIKEGK